MHDLCELDKGDSVGHYSMSCATFEYFCEINFKKIEHYTGNTKKISFHHVHHIAFGCSWFRSSSSVIISIS